MKSKSPLVSVIMPAYNAEHYIDNAVNSIISQTFKSWELLICDDGSTDHTLRIISNYSRNDKRIRIIKNEVNIGKIATVNNIINVVNGDYVTIHDSDDISDPDRFSKIIEEFSLDPELGMVGSFAYIIDQNGAFLREDIRPCDYGDILDAIGEKNAFCGATVVIRKEVVKSIGLYREYFRGYAYEDYDLTFRIAERFKSINLPHFLYYYRQLPTSYSKTINAKHLISKELVQWLAKNRKANGSDCLDRNEIGLVDSFVEEKLAPFRIDSSLVYREYASLFMYNRMWLKAIEASLKAVWLNPLKLINHRTLFYCLRKSMSRKFLCVE